MVKEIKIFGKGKYAVSENQQFVDRSGQLVRPVRDSKGKPTLIPVGRAYAFFRFTYPRQKIQDELPFIRESVKTPNELELSLMEELKNLNTESQLFQIAKEAKDKGMNYVIEGTYPNATNNKTAEELHAILNALYPPSRLFESLFQIVSQKSGRYVFWERK